MIKGELLRHQRGRTEIVEQSSIGPDAGRPTIRRAWRIWIAVLAVLGIWQLGWALDLIPPIGLPSPLEIAIALWQLASSGELWIHLEATLPRLGFGWGLGAALAFAAGVAASRWTAARPFVRAIAGPTATVPAIALLPLFMIWWGRGEGSIIATTALAAFGAGILAVSAAAEGRRNRPAVEGVEALRVSLPVALAVLIAAEMIAGGFGLGALIFEAAELYRSDQIVAGCLVLALIGLTIPALLDLIARKLVREPYNGRESR